MVEVAQMLAKQDAASCPQCKERRRMEDTQMLQQALDANQTLQDEVDRLRKTNMMLRRLNGSLRRANESLRRQQELAVQNDEMFRQICESGFGISVAEPEGGLPEGSVVEATVANVDEAF